MSRRTLSAFTLMEVMLSLAVLVSGLTSVVSIYMVSLTWIEEIRVDLTALQSGRIALVDAGSLRGHDGSPLHQGNLDAVAKGWLNDYYIVRTVTRPSDVEHPSSAGTYVRVRIQVYYGGSDNEGLLAHDFMCDQIIPVEYGP